MTTLSIKLPETKTSALDVSLRGRIGGPCRMCGAELKHVVVDLGMSPLCEDFRSSDQIDGPETYMPLKAVVCDQCFLVQVGEYATPAEIFEEYAYFSSYSTSWLEHAKRYCEAMTERYGFGSDDLVVELGSNDGYLLQYFQELGVRVLGIEPARNVALAARANGIDTIDEFFGVELAQDLVDRGIQADCICGANVMAQVPDLNDFVAGIKLLLKPEGVCTIEFPDLRCLMAENQFDTIYHEHFSYFSTLTTDRLAEQHGLKFFDVEALPTHGGSLRVYLAHQGSSHARTQRLEDRLQEDRDAGLDQLKAYEDFAEQVKETKRKLLTLLVEAKASGKRIVGYGAPGKGNTLLNYCAIGMDFVDFLVHRNPYKHGRYTPGMHIPILPPEELQAAAPDLVLILPWNLKTEIMEQLKDVATWGAKFIVPIPEPRIVDTGVRS